jgi:hypothetical protein
MSENEATIQDIIERASERTMAFMRIEEGESPDTVAAEYVETYMEDVAMVTPDWLQAAKGRMIQAVAANYRKNIV